MNALKMEQEFHELKKEVAEVKDKITQIYSLLIGHEHDEATGILHWKRKQKGD